MYTYDFRVGFSQSDLQHRMTIPAVIDAFQDVSCFQSEDLGVGFGYLEPKNLVWVLNYWEVEFYKMPKYGDRVTSGTFPYEFKGFMGFRNFFLTNEAGEYLAKANSLWVLIDSIEFHPARPDETMLNAYITEPKLDMTYSKRKIAIPEDATKDERDMITVQKQHLDFNGHVNNGQYIKIAMELLPHDIEYKRMRVEYRNQARLGDKMYQTVYSTDNSYTVVLSNEEGTAYSVIELQY